MNPIEQRDINCPYCGEAMGVSIDTTVGDQRYIEDCAVCCQPIEFDVRLDYDTDDLSVSAEVGV